eukprot:3116963-Rhodomonas_salina.1
MQGTHGARLRTKQLHFWVAAYWKGGGLHLISPWRAREQHVSAHAGAATCIVEDAERSAALREPPEHAAAEGHADGRQEGAFALLDGIHGTSLPSARRYKWACSYELLVLYADRPFLVLRYAAMRFQVLRERIVL